MKQDLEFIDLNQLESLTIIYFVEEITKTPLYPKAYVF